MNRFSGFSRRAETAKAVTALRRGEITPLKRGVNGKNCQSDKVGDKVENKDVIGGF
jgi:hypothetical protein